MACQQERSLATDVEYQATMLEGAQWGGFTANKSNNYVQVICCYSAWMTFQYTWLIEGNDCPVLVARAIVAPDWCNVVVKVVNTDLTPRKLYKSMKIACAKHIENHIICEASKGKSTTSTTWRNTWNRSDKFFTIWVYNISTTLTLTPIRQQARGIPLNCTEILCNLLQDMLSENIVSPSQSPWRSPIVLVANW